MATSKVCYSVCDNTTPSESFNLNTCVFKSGVTKVNFRGSSDHLVIDPFISSPLPINRININNMQCISYLCFPSTAFLLHMELNEGNRDMKTE